MPLSEFAEPVLLSAERINLAEEMYSRRPTCRSCFGRMFGHPIIAAGEPFCR
jgi:hypothetical protein